MVGEQVDDRLQEMHRDINDRHPYIRAIGYQIVGMSRPETTPPPCL
jgi:hypothetical protein